MSLQVIDNTSNELDNTSPTSWEEKIKQFAGNVKLIQNDDESGLQIYCYNTCTDTDSNDLKDCRGVILDSNNNLVVKGFPYTNECVVDSRNNNDFHVDFSNVDDVTEYSIYESYEGAIIRIFWYKSRWFITTTRKLDAFKSKWSSKESFGEIFVKSLKEQITENGKLEEIIDENDILNSFYNTLDKEKQYTFLVSNTAENRIVCTPPDKYSVYHVGTTLHHQNVESEINIKKPQKLDFTTKDELTEFVHKIDIAKLQGVIVFAKDKKVYKLYNYDYEYLFSIRGNEPSIKFRYLQIRMDNSSVQDLKYLYPDMAIVFDEYENVLYKVSHDIYNAYVSRYIRKEFIKVSREQFGVMTACHDWYKSDHSKNKISRNKVIDVLNEQSFRNLNHIIKQYLLEEKQLAQKAERCVSVGAENTGCCSLQKDCELVQSTGGQNDEPK